RVAWLRLPGRAGPPRQVDLIVHVALSDHLTSARDDHIGHLDIPNPQSVEKVHQPLCSRPAKLGGGAIDQWLKNQLLTFQADVAPLLFIELDDLLAGQVSVGVSTLSQRLGESS